MPKTKEAVDKNDIDNDPMFAVNDEEKKRAHNSRLTLLIERIERLEEEKKGVADDIKDVYAEAKAVGYDPKIMRVIVRLRKMKPDDRNEYDALIETYRAEAGV